MATATVDYSTNSIPDTWLPATEQVAITDIDKLQEKTVFLKVSYGRLGTTKKMSGAKIETDADKSLLKVQKTLFESPEFEAIRRADAKMREWVVNMTLPFGEGTYMCPKDALGTVIAKLKEYRNQRENELVPAFVTTYPALIKKYQEALGSEYRGTDYPFVDQVASKFTFTWNILTMSVPEDLKYISQEVYDEELGKELANIKSVAGEIREMMRTVFYGLVANLEEHLAPAEDGSKKRLHKTALTKLQEFMVSFPWRNVQDDKELAGHVKKLHVILDGVDITAFKTKGSEDFKAKVLESLGSVKQSMGTMTEIKSGRKYRTEDE